MQWKKEDLNLWIKNGCDVEIAKNVTVLDISYFGNITIETKKETKIPNQVGYLVNLTEFNCSGNEITKIPKKSKI
jgi:hypothetical protein